MLNKCWQMYDECMTYQRKKPETQTQTQRMRHRQRHIDLMSVWRRGDSHVADTVSSLGRPGDGGFFGRHVFSEGGTTTFCISHVGVGRRQGRVVVCGLSVSCISIEFSTSQEEFSSARFGGPVRAQWVRRRAETRKGMGVIPTTNR